jgi:hypothetical protein
MAVDRGYGSGNKGTGKANNRKRQMSGAEKARAKGLREGSLGRRAGASPFNDLKGRAIGWDELAGVAATAGLAAGGMAVARVRASNSPAATRARVIASTRGAVPTKRGTYSNVKGAMEKSGYSYPEGTSDGWGGKRSGTMSPKKFAIQERKAYQEDIRRYGESTGYATAAQRNAIDAGAALGGRKRRVLAKIAYGYFGEPIKQPKRGR